MDPSLEKIWKTFHSRYGFLPLRYPNPQIPSRLTRKYLQNPENIALLICTGKYHLSWDNTETTERYLHLLEYLAEQPPYFLQQVMAHLGLPKLPFRWDVYLILFNVAHDWNRLIPHQGVRDALCQMPSGDLIEWTRGRLDLEDPQTFHEANYTYILWYLLTALRIQEGVLIPGTPDEIRYILNCERRSSSVIKSYLYYGGHEIYSSPYHVVSKKCHDVINKVLDRFQYHLADLPLRIQEIMTVLPRDLARLVGSYLQGHVEALAREIGLLFPYEIQTPYEKERYFLREIPSCTEVIKREEKPLFRQRIKNMEDRIQIMDLIPKDTDQELLDEFGISFEEITHRNHMISSLEHDINIVSFLVLPQEEMIDIEDMGIPPTSNRKDWLRSNLHLMSPEKAFALAGLD